MISRTSSTPVWLAASISLTSICRPSVIARHGSHTPLANCAWREPERPAANSLRLLPSGSDRVGDDHVRPTPARHMAGPGGVIKGVLPADAHVAAYHALVMVVPDGLAHPLR